MRRFMILSVALVGASATALAAGAQSGKLMAKPEIFNPGAAAVAITAAWTPFTGVPDPGKSKPGVSSHGLTLGISALVPYPPGASADATVSPVNGLTLSALGFDHKLGTYCTNGSPRFDVETVAGGVYAFGCASGVHTTAGMPTGWERITFSNADVQVLGGLGWPGFGAATAKLSFLQVLQDEAGTTVLDNLKVNAISIGKPGLNP